MASEPQKKADADKHAKNDVSKLSYEQARDELVKVVSELEQGSSSLEDSLALWERGEALANRCEEWLIGAKARLDAARAGTPAAQASVDPAAGSTTAESATAASTASDNTIASA